MKFAAGITLYNPKDEYVDRIIGYANQFDYIFVQDNTEEELKRQFNKQRLDVNEKIFYMGNGKNIGLPEAFNNILSRCVTQNIDFLCTLDQDSIFDKQLFDTITGYIQNIDISNVAIVAPTPKENIDINFNQDKLILQKKNWVICSGSFINVFLIQRNNIFYDNNYFIDRFDADFCKQIRRKKLQIIKIENAQMIHHCGDKGEHDYLRNYYIFRNRYYYNDKFYLKPISKLRTFLQNLRQINDLKRNANKEIIEIKKIAKQDYIKGDLGKISLDSLKNIQCLEQKKIFRKGKIYGYWK